MLLILNFATANWNECVMKGLTNWKGLTSKIQVTRKAKSLLVFALKNQRPSKTVRAGLDSAFQRADYLSPLHILRRPDRRHFVRNAIVL